MLKEGTVISIIGVHLSGVDELVRGVGALAMVLCVWTYMLMTIMMAHVTMMIVIVIVIRQNK